MSPTMITPGLLIRNCTRGTRSISAPSTNVPNLTTQLSAAAIAFVAGFSIEILFAILDRFFRIIQEFAGCK
jgi:hypothetical protein